MNNLQFVITFSLMMLSIALLHGCTHVKTGEQDADALWCVGACIKVVFIPTLIPTDELIWKWSHAKDTKKDDKCDELTVSPGTCPK